MHIISFRKLKTFFEIEPEGKVALQVGKHLDYDKIINIINI